MSITGWLVGSSGEVVVGMICPEFIVPSSCTSFGILLRVVSRGDESFWLITSCSIRRSA